MRLRARRERHADALRRLLRCLAVYIHARLACFVAGAFLISFHASPILPRLMPHIATLEIIIAPPPSIRAAYYDAPLQHRRGICLRYVIAAKQHARCAPRRH